MSTPGLDSNPPEEGLQRPSVGSSSAVEGNPAAEEREWEENLCQAIVDDNWNKVREILDGHNIKSSEIIHFKGKPPLLLAAQFGSINIVNELLKELPPGSILDRDHEGWTALILACFYNGKTKIAELLVAKNPNLLTIPDTTYDLPPVAWAFSSNFIEMGRYLYDRTPLESLEHPAGLIIDCLRLQCLDIALELLRKHQKLLVKTCPDIVAVDEIAILNKRIPSCSDLSFWERCFYNRINISSNPPTEHVSVDIQRYSGQHDQAKMNEPGRHGLRQRFINPITNFEGVVKKIRELKLLNAQADALYHLVRKNAREKFALHGISQALCLAAKEGNVDFVLQVSKGIPEQHLQLIMFDCFSKALEYRQAKVFNLIHGYRYKPLIINTTDSEDGKGSLLHKAAKSAPELILNNFNAIYSPALQLQRELQWFKEVESLLMSSRVRADQNREGLTAEELFRKEHKELMKEGETWIKNTASSCSIVGILTMTIIFAAAYTVPGGNDQNYGYPLFIKQPYFKVFIFSTIFSLLCSSISILLFLAILTSRYSEKTFLKPLPIKLIFGFFSLFLSIVSMMIAFFSTTYLMLKHTKSLWGLLPMMMLAIVSIFVFMVSELPLVYHICISTYGKIFDRNVKPWP